MKAATGNEVWAVLADQELDQICHSEKEAKKEKRDLVKMGFVVRIIKCESEQYVYDKLNIG